MSERVDGRGRGGRQRERGWGRPRPGSKGLTATPEQRELGVQRLDCRVDERGETALQRGRQQTEARLRFLDGRRLGGEEWEGMQRGEQLGELTLRPALPSLLPPRGGTVHQVGYAQRELQSLAAGERAGGVGGAVAGEEGGGAGAELGEPALGGGDGGGVKLGGGGIGGGVEAGGLDDLGGDLGDEEAGEGGVVLCLVQ